MLRSIKQRAFFDWPGSFSDLDISPAPGRGDFLTHAPENKLTVDWFWNRA